MRAPRLIFVTAAFVCAVSLWSCSLLSGLSKLQEVACAEACDGEADAVTPADAPGAEAVDAPVDAGSDTGTDATALDAGVDAADSGPGDANAGCPGILCDDACVDPTTDPLNCNGCGNVCHGGGCGTSLSASMQTPPPANWLFNGTAQYLDAGPSAALTVANVLYQAGTLIYKNAIVMDELTATFEFRMGYGGGTRNDGMAFLFQKTSATAVGTFGESLAMVGLDGYGVEFDINDNDNCGDVSNDQLGVDSLVNCPAADPLPTSLLSTDLTNDIDMADANWHQAVVTLENGAVSVKVDGTEYAANVALPSFDAGTRYFVGFAGATGGNGLPDGGGGYQTEVRNVVLAFPTPHCF